MAESNTKPNYIQMPFANEGNKNTIPVSDSGTQAASWSAGFPPRTSLPLGQGGLPPDRLDLNGICNVLSAFIVYLQNGGVFTFDASLSEVIGGYAKDMRLWYTDSDGKGMVLRSTKNNNTDNFLTDPSYIGSSWVIDIATSFVKNIGDIFYTTRTDTELNGAVECNGATYTTSDFEGAQTVGGLLAAGKLPYVSLTDYQNIVDQYGSCRCFGWNGSSSTSFRVPLLSDVYIEAGDAETSSEFLEESLPNISGSFYATTRNLATTGAFTASKAGNASTNDDQDLGYFAFNASSSSSSYQNGAKVKTDRVRYRAMIQIATGTTDEAFEICTSVLSDVASLKSSVSGISDYIVESYDDGAGNWYRIYKSGWVEQGGRNVVGQDVYFLKPFANTNYTITGTEIWSNNVNPWANTSFKAINITAEKFYNYVSNINNQGLFAGTIVSWYACGQGASTTTGGNGGGSVVNKIAYYAYSGMPSVYIGTNFKTEWGDSSQPEFESLIATSVVVPESDADLRNLDGSVYTFDGTYPKYFVENGSVFGYSSAKMEGLGEQIVLVRQPAVNQTLYFKEKPPLVNSMAYSKQEDGTLIQTTGNYGRRVDSVIDENHIIVSDIEGILMATECPFTYDPYNNIKEE